MRDVCLFCGAGNSSKYYTCALNAVGHYPIFLNASPVNNSDKMCKSCYNKNGHLVMVSEI